MRLLSQNEFGKGWAALNDMTKQEHWLHQR